MSQMGQYTGLSPDQLLNSWMTLNDGWPFAQRDLLIKEMQKRGLFPDSSKNILDGGIYPDTEDPNFIARLLAKTEFADTASTFDPNEDLCKAGPGFEVTPVQRFVATFLHPRTPYRSMLLYHGVGVGKTCAAIQAAEAYLDIYPRRPAIIVAPPNIQPGFERTIFDMERLVIGKGNSPNRMDGCTGDTYLRLTGCAFERDPKIIAFRVKKAIKYRYRFYGYRQFSGRISKIIAKIQMTGDDTVDNDRIRERLRKDLDFHFLIIDEAHNLADVKGTATSLAADEDDLDTQGSVEEKEELRAGKILTPFLRKLLEETEGMKLLLMTATPMFNSVFEIKFLLDLMLLNDNKSPIADGAILNKDGTLTETADQILKPIANAYVSFMRGENPNSFPLRLFPEQGPGGIISRISVENYPKYRLAQKSPPQEVTDSEKQGMSKLPLVRSEVREGTLAHLVLSELTTKKISELGTKFTVIDSLLQAGNCVFPVDDDPLENPEAFVGSAGFNATFKKMGRGVVRCEDPSWLALENLGDYSPKLASIVELINYAEGVQFAYSRFVSNGAYILALALEANGYTPYGRETGYLANGIQSPGGRQCAFCSMREAQHAGDHPFRPAKFVLLTGDKEISPRNNDSISAARNLDNKDGGIIKVVIGSTIAGEGLDLRFIRETHILDAWFHLNKTEQIIGRGIRFCSHSSLDIKKRNTTVYLHCVTFPVTEDMPLIETADLFCYRYALSKAVLIGKVSRKLKVFALDCNLRKGATVLKGLGRRIQVDSQRYERRGDGQGISLDDMDFTVMCDWMECEYSCIPDVTVNVDVSDDSTYDAFSSRYRETLLKGIIQKMFNQQPYYKSEDFLNALLISGIPTTAVFLLLQGIVNNPLFRIAYGNQEGYLAYKNGYFLFQPDRYKDVLIPMALRIADVPIKQDEFDPRPMEKDVPPPIEGEEGEDKSESLWGLLQGWATGVASGSVTSLDIAIERKLETIIDSKQKLEVLKDRLRMILFMATKITDKTIFEKILLEYFWDSWMSVKEQTRLLLRNPDYKSLASEMVVESGKITAIRSVNPETGILEFLCPDGKPCPPGVQEALMLDTIERKANTNSVGNWYGFYVPKRGIMVFKINKPHEVEKKPRGGQEICGRSGSGNWQEPLIDLQKSLPPMGFDQKSLIGSGIANNIQGCTVVELCMRYMDEKKIGGKRWFFRPISAFMSGHVGTISQTAKVEVKAFLAEQKKSDAEKKKVVKAGIKLAKKNEEKKKVVEAPSSGKLKIKRDAPAPAPAPEPRRPALKSKAKDDLQMPPLIKVTEEETMDEPVVNREPIFLSPTVKTVVEPEDNGVEFDEDKSAASEEEFNNLTTVGVIGAEEQVPPLALPQEQAQEEFNNLTTVGVIGAEEQVPAQEQEPPLALVQEQVPVQEQEQEPPLAPVQEQAPPLALPPEQEPPLAPAPVPAPKAPAPKAKPKTKLKFTTMTKPGQNE